MKKCITMLLILALLASVPAAGFAAAEEESKALTAEELEALDRIGEETEECYAIALENAAGADAVSVAVREIGGEEWSDELLAEDDVFEDGETALLCWTPAEDENDMKLYEIRLTFDDETESVLHMVPLSDMETAKLLRDEQSGLAYLVYTSLTNEKEVDTLQTEQRVAGQAREQEGGWSFAGSAGGDDSTGGNTTGCIGDGALFY